MTLYSLSGINVATNAKDKNEIQSPADNNQFVCDICMDTSDDRLSYGCQHYYCRNCVQTNFETAINEGQIDSFKCPEPTCDFNASENFVKMVVSTAVFDRYEKLMLKKAVGDMDDIVNVD